MTSAFVSSGLIGTMFQDRKVAEAFSAETLTAKMCAFERAWSAGLVEIGRVDAADGAAAIAVIDSFVPDFDALAERSDRDGLPLPGLVAQLRQGQPESISKALHSGATSQDVIDTATVLTCRDVLGDFALRAQDCLAQLEVLSQKFGAAQMMGRTRMQAALPMQVSDRLRTWQAPLQNHLAVLPALLQSLSRVQVGGPIGVRNDDTDAIVAHVAKALNLEVAPVWHTDRTAFADLGHWLMLLTGTLGKIGMDIALMAQQGVDEVALDGAGGSSAMPHKQNPVRAEALVTLARYVAGQQGILGQAMVHEQERSGTAWALEWMVLPAMFEATGASLNQAQALFSQIKRLGAAD